MKRCPTCQRTFTEDTQKFCANDGTRLVADEAPAFDPEATVMSSASQLNEESSAQPSSAELPPTQYFTPGSEPGAQAEQQDIHQSYPPPSSAPGGQPAPQWSPAPAPPPQQQQPYYPQQGMAGGQPAPPWQGGQQQPQQPQWMPPGQQQPQGQNWGGAYYPQPGQYAPQAAKGQGLSLVTLIIGGISFIMFALVFGMFQRIIPPDRTVAEITIYGTLIAGIIAVLLGVITLISAKGRKMLAIIGVLISIPGILFFLYIASQYGMP